MAIGPQLPHENRFGHHQIRQPIAVGKQDLAL
jgi:hypothetical protein